MAKINLKRMGRFELLEMLYEMRKKNLEMTQIVKETRKRADEIQATLDQRVEAVRAEYEKQLEELRQNNSSAQLQERLKSIEQQLNMYQQVVAVGSTVHDVKEGDIVMINFDRYLTAQHVPGKIENNIQSDKFSAKYEIPMVKLDGIDYLFLQQNDIVFVVTDYDGIEGGGLLE